jgi:hypothetical protein
LESLQSLESDARTHRTPKHFVRNDEGARSVSRRIAPPQLHEFSDTVITLE